MNRPKFSLIKIETIHDVVAHARTFAPMVGSTSKNYEAAHERLGALRAAATVWEIVQFHDKNKVVVHTFAQSLRAQRVKALVLRN
jgi:replication initiation protein RepC